MGLGLDAGRKTEAGVWVWKLEERQKLVLGLEPGNW